MSQVKLLQITTITSQGVSFDFSGLPHFNQKYFSWEAICKAVLRREDEVVIAEDCTMPEIGHVDNVYRAVEVLCSKAHEANLHWWKDNQGNDIRDNPLTFSNKLLLIVTEIAEACEGDRKSLMDDKLPHRPMREVELADALLRIVDLAAGYGMDLPGAVVEKMEFNRTRPDHSIEGRLSTNGKTY